MDVVVCHGSAVRLSVVDQSNAGAEGSAAFLTGEFLEQVARSSI